MRVLITGGAGRLGIMTCQAFLRGGFQVRLSVTMYLIFMVSDLKRMFSVPLDNRLEFCHSNDAALTIINAVRDFDKVNGETLIIS